MLDSLIVRLIFPTSAIGLAMAVETGKWGLFNTIELPHAVTVVLSILLLDFAIYLQHVMFHAVPALWRLHMVHHADQDFDLTTGVRFHPIENHRMSEAGTVPFRHVSMRWLAPPGEPWSGSER